MQGKGKKCFDTLHKDLIHDAQLDYFGRTLATASSDRSIKLFEVTQNTQTFVTDLVGHQGPVWRVSWAHPSFGQILASCGYDRRIIIWRFNKSSKQWESWFVDDSFTHSVNCIEFAPYECGLILAAGCADGTMSIYRHGAHGAGNAQKQGWFACCKLEAHNGGVNSLSWCNQVNTVTKGGAKQDGKQDGKQGGCVGSRLSIVSGGCDSVVKVWQFDVGGGSLAPLGTLNGHSDWVRDVAWSPMPGSICHGIVASCSEDQSVIIWKQEHDGKWKESARLKFNHKVWSVSWSQLGNILGVAQGDNTIQLFKEGEDATWKDISKVEN